MDYPLDFPLAWGPPPGQAMFKLTPEDFEVEEVLGFEPDGEGEHLCLLIEKTGLTTPEAAALLARHYGLSPRELSWAGLKDKQGVTRQWLSLRVGLKRELPPAFPATARLRILDSRRNGRKIRTGSHRGNRFRIVLHPLPGAGLDIPAVRLARVGEQGVPNYFGPQRFGREGDNVARAAELFSGALRVRDRFLRGMLISAARAWLFNQLLARRVLAGNWNRYLEGDFLALDGGRGGFVPQGSDEALEARLRGLDVHPSGPLWGVGEPLAGGQAGILERELGAAFPGLCRGLEAQGLKQERRALRMKVEELGMAPAGGGKIVVEFRLARGGYATTVLRELVRIAQAPPGELPH